MLAEQILAYLPERGPVAILLCGLPGAGKTWLARLLHLRLNEEREALHLQTDRIRHELFPVRRYTQEEGEAVYRELLHRAEKALGAGRSVILDGTFLMTEGRAEAYALFRRLGIPSIAILVTATEGAVQARFTRKALISDSADLSEATFDVHLGMKERLNSSPEYSFPTTDHGVRVLVVDTERGKLVDPYSQPQLDGFYESFAGLDAAIFDMDGVIIRSEDAWISSEREFLEGQGIYLGDEGWQKFQLRHAPYLAGRNQTEAALFYRETFALKESVEEIRRKRMALVRRHFTEVALVSGVVELIVALGEGGLKLGLASGSPLELIELVLRNHDLGRFFSAVISGDEICKAKPHPAIYLLAAQKLGVRPAQCLVFEDAPNGVKAASAAGMRCAYLPNPALRWRGEVAPDFVLESFAGLELSRLREILALRRAQ